jgi:glycosyltransferase involved in cell wall biosynthesis
MKVIIGITKSNWGGAQRYVFDLATGARNAGFDVAVLCGGNGPLVQKLKEENIRVISIPGFGRDISWFKDFLGLCFIFKTIWKEKPDVFHINSAKMGGAGIFSGRILGVPRIIFTSHGYEFNESRPEWQKVLIKFLNWAIIFFAHKTICVSENTKRQVENWPFIRNRLFVVHNGLSGFEMRTGEEARQALSLQNDILLVGTMAELHKIKGLDVIFIIALKKFIDKYNARIVVFGAGEEKHNLEELAQEINIAGSVEFKGFVDNARSLIKAFDIFIMPSRSENLPYAILEAGFAGLPVVATSVGGIPEIIESEKNGLLVPKENSEALLSALTRLADDTALREKLGVNLRQTILSKFSLEKMLRETLALYTAN